MPRRRMMSGCLAGAARPRRRSLGLHAALRPRAVRARSRRRGRGRRRSSRAASPTARCRRADGYAARRALLPPRGRRAGRHAAPAAKLAQHVPDMLRLPPRGRAPPTSCTSSGSPSQQRRRAPAPRGAPLVLTAHDVLPREPRPGQRRRAAAAATSASTPSSSTPSTGAAGSSTSSGSTRRRVARHPARRVRRTSRTCRARVRSRPSSRRSRRRSSCASGCCARTRASTCCCEAWRGDRGRRAVDRRRCRGWTPRRCVRPRRRACASSSASSPTASSPRSSAAPTSPCCPTARSTSRACSFDGARVRAPLLLSDVGGFPEVAATGAAELVPPGDPRRAARGARRAARRRPAARAGAGGGVGGRAAGPYAWGADRRAHLALYDQGGRR